MNRLAVDVMVIGGWQKTGLFFNGVDEGNVLVMSRVSSSWLLRGSSWMAQYSQVFDSVRVNVVHSKTASSM